MTDGAEGLPDNRRTPQRTKVHAFSNLKNLPLRRNWHAPVLRRAWRLWSRGSTPKVTRMLLNACLNLCVVNTLPVGRVNRESDWLAGIDATTRCRVITTSNAGCAALTRGMIFGCMACCKVFVHFNLRFKPGAAGHTSALVRCLVASKAPWDEGHKLLARKNARKATNMANFMT